MASISKRLLDIINLLPLKEGIRILEIGCGTGSAAREICNRFENIYILAIDRSDKAIEQSVKNSKEEIKSGKLKFQKAKIEEFEIKEEKPFDLAFAIRVGGLDGRHPELEKKARENVKAALKPRGRFFIDVLENSIQEIKL